MFVEFLQKESEKERLTYKIDEPLFSHSSFGIGGCADIAVFPKSKDALVDTLRAAKKYGVEYRIFGNGTNVLFPDDGIRGAVIFTTGVNGFSYDGDILTAECGAGIVRLALSSAKKGLSGLEFASGIPGSLGGAVFMNAGAYGGEIADILIESEYLDLDSLEVKTLEEHAFGYRYSIYKDMNALILSAKLKLSRDDTEAINGRIEEYRQKRTATQPYDKKSAGSTFKRKPPYITAKLIDEAGLKGLSVGGASVSEKHAGFIVNNGGASAADVICLIDTVKARVFEKFGVEIECEIIIEGETR